MPSFSKDPLDGHVVTQSARELYGEVLTTPIPSASNWDAEQLENKALELENQHLRLLDEVAYIIEEKQHLQITLERINSDYRRVQKGKRPATKKPTHRTYQEREREAEV